MKKALIFLLLLIVFVNYSGAVRKTSVQRIRHSSYKGHTRVVLDLSGPVKFSRKFLPNPDRIFFDLANCLLSKKISSLLPVGDDILKSVRIAQNKKNKVRVVFDLKNSKNYSAFMLENPHRLVIDIYASKTQSTPKKKKSNITIKKKQMPAIRTVVIDAGHGGKDPGAVGPGGLLEKDITLAVSKKLGKILKAKHGINIIYTRERDIFVPLNDRTEIANSKKADLFISIHVNASKSRRTRGIETYFLNWTNNREATRVAARENRISYKKMRKIQNELQFILNDLARNSKREESMRLAHSVQNSMVSTLKQKYKNIENLGVKYALFYVLVGAEMPSILAEISFISNKEDEQRLSRASYRNRIAEAIAKGVDSYMSQSTLIVSRSGEKRAALLSERVKKTGDNI